MGFKEYRPRTDQEVAGGDVTKQQNSSTKELYSTVVEQDLLGALLADNSQIQRTRFLSLDDFYSENHGKIYQAILDCQQAKGSVNSVMLYDSDLDRNLATLAMDCQKAVCAPSNAIHYAQSIQHYSIKRKLLAELEIKKEKIIAGEDEFSSGIGRPLPLPDGRPSVVPFDYELLPEKIRGYIRDISERQQCPPDFVAVAAICALAGLLGRKAVVQPKANDDWHVTPTQWGVIIGRPSTMKSPSIKAALSPIYKIEKDALLAYEAALKEYEIDLQLNDIKCKQNKKIVKDKLKNNDREAARGLLMDEMAQHEKPAWTRIIVNDSTVEKLGELLNENQNGLLLQRDELAGWLSKLAQEEHQGDRAFYLECFDGDGRFTFDRIGRGTIAINNCTLSIVGGIQPSKLAPLIRGAVNGCSDDGLIQRVLQLAVWPDNCGKWEWVDRVPDATAMQQYYEIFQYLYELNFYNDNKGPKVFKFSLAAQSLFIEWVSETQAKARADNIHPSIESHLLKMQKTIAGLALLFELIDGGCDSVGEVALARALDWADYLESHAQKIYSLAISVSIEGAKIIFDRRSKLSSPFTIRDVIRKGWSGLSEVKIVKQSIDLLLENHYLIEVDAVCRSYNAKALTYVWSPFIEESK